MKTTRSVVSFSMRFLADGSWMLAFLFLAESAAWAQTPTPTPMVSDLQFCWAQLYGTAAIEEGYAVATDSEGSVYLAGLYSTNSQTFLAKYNPGGTKLWERFLNGQTGSYVAITVDAQDAIYLTGEATSAQFEGQTVTGVSDAYVVKFSKDGTKLWAEVAGFSSYDEGKGVAVDSNGFVWVVGSTFTSGGTTRWEVLIARFHPLGYLDWTQSIAGPGEDHGWGITADGSGNVWVSGATDSNPFDGLPGSGGLDAFVMKYTGSVRAWTRILGGTGDEEGRAITNNGSGNVYLTGFATSSPFHGQVNAGLQDCFLIKLDSDGTRLWTRLFGSTSYENGASLAVGNSNAVFIAGSTSSAELDGFAPIINNAAFVTKFSDDGVRQWTRVLDTVGYEGALGVALNFEGDVYLSGLHQGSAFFGQPNQGSIDAFLVSLCRRADLPTFTPTPLPTATPTPTCVPAMETVTKTFNTGWNGLGFHRQPAGVSNAQELTSALGVTGISVSHVAEWTGSGWRIYAVGLPLNNFTLQKDMGYLVRTANSGIWTYQVSACP